MSKHDEGYDNDQLKFREQHGDLVWEKVRTGAKLVELRKRDGWQSRLIESLSEPHQDAMVEIERGWRSITAGVGMRIFTPGQVGGKSTGTDHSAAIVADYLAWGRELLRQKISHAMAMAIIAEGLTANEVDCNYRQRKGTAIRNLHEALNAFCKLRGWPTEKKI